MISYIIFKIQRISLVSIKVMRLFCNQLKQARYLHWAYVKQRPYSQVVTT